MKTAVLRIPKNGKTPNVPEIAKTQENWHFQFYSQQENYLGKVQKYY